MNTQHTPVPWHANGMETTKANASLIAAAPELLAALNTLKEATMSPLGYGLEEAIAIADSAIAKATGKSTP